MTDSVPRLSVLMEFALETLLPAAGRVNVGSILDRELAVAEALGNEGVQWLLLCKQPFNKLQTALYQSIHAQCQAFAIFFGVLVASCCPQVGVGFGSRGIAFRAASCTGFLLLMTPQA
ncbi:hypothetical protein SD70_18305 [Gordoniibacillus kamchatkensis]|uniref:Uncharacterized protein n=1 Tax=Gordoniibacillus kamchatkensis TaxID=1590651 RepID=A0ABR5AFC8_9BACL|nr:hypothetical protein SD70_18305 [Paenibacillus sp. VKM B-2647]